MIRTVAYITIIGKDVLIKPIMDILYVIMMITMCFSTAVIRAEAVVEGILIGSAVRLEIQRLVVWRRRRRSKANTPV